QIRTYPAMKWEEAVYDLVIQSLRRQKLVVVDDFQDICAIGSARNGLFTAMRRRFNEFAIEHDRRLVFGGRTNQAWYLPGFLFGESAAVVSSGTLSVEDYAAFFGRLFTTEQMAALDFAVLHRSAPMLDLYQLKFMVNLLSTKATELDTR